MESEADGGCVCGVEAVMLEPRDVTTCEGA